MNKFKKMIPYITVTFIILCVLFIIWIKRYNLIEKKYIEAARIVYEDNGIENISNIEKIILTRKEINYLLSKPILDNKCNGYVMIDVSSQGASFKPFIKCNKYETKGFDKKYLQ